MNMAATPDARADPDECSGAIDPSPAQLIRERLLQTRRVAREGAPHRARRLCAQSVLEWQPWICRDADLLQLAIATLFEVRSFQLLRRLLDAARGRRVRFVSIPPNAPEPLPDGIIATDQADGTLVFHFADTLFDDPTDVGLLDAWSRAMAASEGDLRAA